MWKSQNRKKKVGYGSTIYDNNNVIRAKFHTIFTPWHLKVEILIW